MVEPDEIIRLETDYRKAKDAFDQDTRAEFTRIARDRSLIGEAKILAIQIWFASRALLIEKITRDAEQLDKLQPITVPPPTTALETVDTPEARNGFQIQMIFRRYAKGKIEILRVEGFYLCNILMSP